MKNNQYTATPNWFDKVQQTDDSVSTGNTYVTNFGSIQQQSGLTDLVIEITGEEDGNGLSPEVSWNKEESKLSFVKTKFLKEGDPVVDADYVTTIADNPQDVLSNKDFINGLSINKHRFFEKDGILYLDGNLALTGGLVIYADNPEGGGDPGPGFGGGTILDISVTGEGNVLSDVSLSEDKTILQFVKTNIEFSGNYVDFTSDQDISGVKNFTNGIKINGSRIYKENGVIYLEGDLAVTGGITTFATAGKNISTIMDGIVADEVTITVAEKDGIKQLQLKEGVGGGLTSAIITGTGNAVTDASLEDEGKTLNLKKDKTFLIPNDLLGYAKEDWVTNQLQSYVTLNTEQDITAIKNFLEGITIGSSKKKFYEKDGVLYIDSDVAFTGGITTFATDNVSVTTIMDGVAVDGTTITKEGGVLKVIGGGGSSFDSAEMWKLLEADTTEQINRSHLTNALQGYATTDSVSTLQTEITKKWTQNDAKIKDWDTAFGWGNHAEAGYAHLANEEIFTGLKHFLNGLTVGEGKHKLYEKDGVVYLDGDLAVTGGITQYALGDTPVSTIMDGVVTDGVTITKQDGKLVVIGGTGSDFNVTAMWAALSATTNEQINHSHLTTALQGYATEDWVTEKNYAVKATTLAEYGITDAYTKTETDNKYLLKTSYTAADVLAKLKTVDGVDSGLDADLLDGTHKSGLFTALTSTSATNISITVGGTTKSITDLYANSAAKLETARTIWGQSFDGTKPISGALTSVTDITGTGTFTGANIKATSSVYVNGIRLYKSADNTLKIEGNLLVTGGITQYSTEESGGGSGGGGIDVDALWEILGGTGTKQINKSHLTDALKGYLTSVSLSTISDLHSSWNALLKAAPSGYVTRWPTISEVTNKQSLVVKLNSGTTEGTNMFTYNATTAKSINITPSAIGAAASSHNHSWANITSGKPNSLAGYGITDAYTKTESDGKYPTKTGGGASGTWGINISGTAANANKVDNVSNGNLTSRYWNPTSLLDDLNNYRHNSFAAWHSDSANKPYEYGTLFQFSNQDNPIAGTNGHWVNQIAYGTNERMYVRQRINNGSWTTWRTLAYISDTIPQAENSNKLQNLTWSDFFSRRYYYLDYGAQSTSNFYPIFFFPSDTELDCEIHSDNVSSADSYNQNRIHFQLTAQGWSDTGVSFRILSRNNHGDSEITIGSIGYGNKDGGIAIWVRGGKRYRLYCNKAPNMKTSDFTYGSGEKYTVGPNLWGGNNESVSIVWKNDSTRNNGVVATVDGNVYSATKLQTTRTIWGQSFNGENNVSGSLSDVLSINSQVNKWLDLKGSSGVAFYVNGLIKAVVRPTGYVGIGTENPSYLLDVKGDIKADGWVRTSGNQGWYAQDWGGGWYMQDSGWIRVYGNKNILTDGSIQTSRYVVKNNSTSYFSAFESVNNAITGTDPDYKWIWYHAKGADVQRGFTLWSYAYGGAANQVASFVAYGGNLFKVFGNILATGGITQYSDKRAKTIIEQITLPLQSIANSPVVRFRWNGWKQKDDGKTHIGGIAQYVQRILPEAIYNTDGAFTMDYATTGYIFAVNTAKHLLSYETKTDKKIRKLEKEIVYLKKQLKKLGYEEANIMDN